MPCEAGDEVCDCDDHAAASNHMNQVCPSDPGQHHSNHRCGGVTETVEFPQPLRNSSGSLAIFTAIRRAPSRSNNFAADLRPGSFFETYASACPLWSRTTKQASCSSTDQGGGKGRAGIG